MPVVATPDKPIKIETPKRQPNAEAKKPEDRFQKLKVRTEETAEVLKKTIPNDAEIGDEREFADLASDLKQLTAETEQKLHSPRDTLEKIVSLSDYRELNVKARKAQINKWGKAVNHEQYSKQMEQWKHDMNNWFVKLDQKTQQDIEIITSLLGIQKTELNGTERPSWNLLKDKLSTNGAMDVGKFVDFIRANGNALKGKTRALREISRMYGHEVMHDLFGEQTSAERWKQDEKRRKQVVDKAIKEGKITPEKAQKFDKYIEGQSLDHDRIVNGIQFDSRFTIEQRQNIINALKLFPAELLQQVAKIGKLKSDEFKAGGLYHSRGLKQGTVKIAEEYIDQHYEQILAHEIGGHALRDMIYRVDGGQSKLEELWHSLNTIHPNLISKDSNAQGYIKGKFHYLFTAIDEFWADRMSEYWIKKNNPSSTFTSFRATPFTPEEQQFIDEVCEKSAALMFESSASFLT